MTIPIEVFSIWIFKKYKLITFFSPEKHLFFKLSKFHVTMSSIFELGVQCFDNQKIDFNKPVELEFDVNTVLVGLSGIKKAKSPKKLKSKSKELKLKKTIKPDPKAKRRNQESEELFRAPKTALSQNPASRRSEKSREKYEHQKSTEVEISSPPIVVLSHLQAHLFLQKEGKAMKEETELQFKTQNGVKAKSKSKKSKIIHCCRQTKKGRKRVRKPVIIQKPKFIIETINFENADIKQCDFLGSLELIQKN